MKGLFLHGVQFFVTEDGTVFRSSSWGIKRCKISLNRDGYQQVSIRSKCGYHKIRVHKLVALAYIPNPNNYPVINHKDEDKTNNHVSNLEWCTVYHNNHWAGRYERTKWSHKAPSEETLAKQRKPVIQIDPVTGNKIGEYRSVTDAAHNLGLDVSRILKCCHGNKGCKTTGWYYWRLKKDYSTECD